MKYPSTFPPILAVQSPPSWWSGLKYSPDICLVLIRKSPPSWWSGLKSVVSIFSTIRLRVSTLVVEWIEILNLHQHSGYPPVSTLVVEWIEMAHNPLDQFGWHVSTLVVEWIEICSVSMTAILLQCLHPRGGVD